MSLSLRGELLFLALSLLFGILLGLLYDLFRFLRALLGVYPLKAVKSGRAAPVPKVIITTFFIPLAEPTFASAKAAQLASFST